MDKIFSARMDEAVIREVALIAEQLKTTKKAVVEEAVRAYGDRVRSESGQDVLDRTFGAWKRTEKPNETVRRAREAFRNSMGRHSR